MNFGEALELIKSGKKVSRSGWNGKNLWIAYNPGSIITVSEGRPLAASLPVGTVVSFRPYIIMKTADDEIVPWLASQSDLLCDDWSEV